MTDLLPNFFFDPTKCFIGGRWVAPLGGDYLPVENPSDGTEFAKIPRGQKADIDAAVAAARAALDGPWGRTPAAERGRILTRIGQKVLERVDDLARLEAMDVGKPLKQARADALALARYMEFYGGAADKLMGETIPYLDGYTVYTLREPHGVTGHIIPWNYPMQVLGRSVGGALTMGNACVLKPAEEACLTAIAFAKIAEEAGLPPGVLNVVPGLGEEAGAALAAHPGIDLVSFTGSNGVGTLVQEAAAKNAVKCVLELGGKSPQIVFADADLDAVIPVVINAIVQNAGQTCSAGSRVLIQRDIYEPLLERLGHAFEALRVGPAAMDLDVGPLIRQTQQQRVWDFLSDAQHAGIPMVAQGIVVEEAPETGFYQAPTLLRDVPVNHRLAQEEVFGPVLAAMQFADEDEAVALANATQFGLVAGVWTADGARQFRMAKRVKSGQVFINNYGAGGGVELPFGGVKSSGYGREKGFEALYGFTTLKTVAVKHG
eukprot:gene38952-biopygen30989